MKNILTLCLAALPYLLLSQVANELERTAIPFSPGETGYPSVGGFNAPMFSPVDLNNDGKQDLFAFDRIGNVNRTFEYQTNKWIYRPEFLDNFPKLNDWVLLRDFNGDGAMDIFTYNDGAVAGIRVFKGKFVNGKLAFDRMNFAFNGNVIAYPNGAFMLNLYVNSVDIPAIDDIDGDGDLDILAFEVGGGHVYWYKNLSVERNFRRDSLIFDLEDRCWGKFFDNGFQPAVKLGTQSTCATQLVGGVIVAPRHPGATLATFDADNDGVKDCLIGSVSYPNLSFLKNSGTVGTAWMSSQNNNFPQNTEGVNLPVFTAAFFADLDLDSKRDVVVTTVSTNFVENRNVAWFYKNTGTNAVPTWQLQKKDFLISDMVDAGNNSNPALADINRDGLLDLVVGNGSFFVGSDGRDARLFYYQNIGSAAAPSFRLIDSNWLNFKQFASIDINNYAPTFGDLDGDGDADLIVGEETGTLYYVQNLGNSQFAAPIPNWKNIKAGYACKPTIADLDRDGLPDIVIGTGQGALNFFKNIGTRSNPNFTDTATIQQLGRVNVSEIFDPTGFAAPQFVDMNGKWTLFVGANNGQLWVFDQIDNNLNGTFRTVNNNYGKLKDGWRVTPAIGNVKSDDGKLEIILGNRRGGLTTYRMGYNVNGTTAAKTIDNQQVAAIFPNPTTGFVTIDLKQNAVCQLKTRNAIGQILKSEQILTPQYQTDLTAFGSGIFFFELRFENGQKQILKVFKSN